MCAIIQYEHCTSHTMICFMVVTSAGAKGERCRDCRAVLCGATRNAARRRRERRVQSNNSPRSLRLCGATLHAMYREDVRNPQRKCALHPPHLQRQTEHMDECTSRVASGRNGARVENPPLLVQRRGADRSADCGLHRWKTQRFPNVLAVLEPSYLSSESPQCQGIAPGRLDERTLLATGGSQ